MESKSVKEIIIIVIILAVTIIVMVSLMQVVVSEYARKAPVEQEISTQTAVYLMRDTTGVSGSFFLGTGMLHDTLQYVVYVDAGNGGKRLISLPVDKTVIYEDEDDAPYLTKTDLCYVQPETSEVKTKIFSYRYPNYEFHVPAGTIVREYVLNGAAE